MFLSLCIEKREVPGLLIKVKLREGRLGLLAPKRKLSRVNRAARPALPILPTEEEWKALVVI